MSDIEHSVYKPIDGPWIALLVIGILMIISSIIAIVMLYFFWRRYQRRTQLNQVNYILNPKPNGNNIQIPIQINDRQPQSYETQVCIKILFYYLKRRFRFFAKIENGSICTTK